MSAATTWCGSSFITFNGTWCTGSNSYIHTGGKFHGKDLGNITADFTIGGELQVTPKSDIPAQIFCKIDDDDLSIQSASMPRSGDDWDNSKHQTENGASGGITVSIASLAPGEHTIAVWFSHDGAYDNNSNLNYVATFTIPAAPTVEMLGQSKIFVDETITFSVNSLNVTDPVYTYSVKTPGASDFESITGFPYTPANGVGTYSFKVEVAADADPTTILDEEVKDVEVVAIPEPITIKLKVPDAWTSTISIYNWNTDLGGNFVTATIEEDWYVYTFERLEVINLIFINGTGFTSNGNQTANIEGVVESTCYEVNAATDGEGKRTVTSVDCVLFTDIKETTDNTNSVIASAGMIEAKFEGTAKVEVYTVDGLLISQKSAQNETSITGLNAGAYFVKINNEVFKVLVK